MLGVPWDENSSFLRGAAEAPARIRAALHSGSANPCAESGVDLGADERFRDAGDVELARGAGAPALELIEEAVASLLDRGARVLALGGDHAVTWPILRAHAKRCDGLTILHLDAHPDLYEELGGNRASHASPFARIMEEGLARRLVQVGIRTMNAHQKEQAARFGVEVVEMRHWRPGALPELDAPVYLSVDLDVLDPAFAPGVSHHEPGGMSVRDVIEVIQGLTVPLAGADIVEFNPKRDVNGMTAMVATKLLKEIAAQMLSGSGSG